MLLRIGTRFSSRSYTSGTALGIDSCETRRGREERRNGGRVPCQALVLGLKRAEEGNVAFSWMLFRPPHGHGHGHGLTLLVSQMVAGGRLGIEAHPNCIVLSFLATKRVHRLYYTMYTKARTAKRTHSSRNRG